jgi:glycosyltransferase involved in cell wall biosynthesis
MPADTVIIVSAFEEAARLPATLGALALAFPGASVVVADDGSADATAHVALQAGVELVRSPVTIGKGGVATLAAHRVLARAHEADPPTFLLCDGDLGETAAQLPRLVAAVRDGECDVAVAAFARRVGGGLGLALRFSRWATRRLGGAELGAPISGQRAMRGDTLPLLVPFAPRFGMETAMNIDAARAGLRIAEIELELAHRATGKSLRGFLHRGRQLVDFGLVYLDRGLPTGGRWLPRR